jgi:hypothetical protein
VACQGAGRGEVPALDAGADYRDAERGLWHRRREARRATPDEALPGTHLSDDGAVAKVGHRVLGAAEPT